MSSLSSSHPHSKRSLCHCTADYGICRPQPFRPLLFQAPTISRMARGVGTELAQIFDMIRRPPPISGIVRVSYPLQRVSRGVRLERRLDLTTKVPTVDRPEVGCSLPMGTAGEAQDSDCSAGCALLARGGKRVTP